MKTATATQVKARFEAYLKQSESAPVIVTKRGKPVAMLVAVTAESDADDIVWTPRLQQILDDARRRIAAGEGIPHNEFWKQVAKQKMVTKPASRKPKAATKRSVVRT